MYKRELFFRFPYLELVYLAIFEEGVGLELLQWGLDCTTELFLSVFFLLLVCCLFSWFAKVILTPGKMVYEREGWCQRAIR